MQITVLFVLYFFVFFIINRLFIKEQKYKNIILLILLFTLSFHISLGHRQLIQGELIPIQIHSVVIALICCLLMVANKKTFVFGKETFFFIPIFLYFSFEYFIRIDDYTRYFSIVFTFLSIYLLFLIFRSLPFIDLDKILYSFNYLAIINGVLIVAQFLTGKKLLIGEFNVSILYTQGAEEINRAIGLAGTNNSAGNFGAILFGIVLYNCLKRKNIIDYIAVLFTLIGSALTLTRLGYVAIIVEILVFLLLYRNKTKKGIYKKIISINFSVPFISLILLIFSTDMINTLFVKRGDTTSSRFEQYERVFKNILPDNWLFGIGTGQYKTYLYNKYGLIDIDIHSQYLNILAELGVFIFILFVCFNLWLIFKILSSKVDRLIKILALSIFIGNLICSNFNPNQYYYLVNILYYLAILTIVFYAKQKNKMSFLEEKQRK